MYLVEERFVNEKIKELKPDAVIILENNPLANYSFIPDIYTEEGVRKEEFITEYSESLVVFLWFDKEKTKVRIGHHTVILEEYMISKGMKIHTSLQGLARKFDEVLEDDDP